MKIALQHEMKTNLIHEELIKIGIKNKSKVEVISLLSELLHNYDYVSDGFCEAVLEREKKYPTGLPFPIGVAIPHTDAIHVYKSAIACGVLSDPVRFGEMGSVDKEMDVKIVCVLAIEKPEMIIPVLRNLIKNFQNTVFLNEILNAKSPKSLTNILKNNLSSL